MLHWVANPPSSSGWGALASRIRHLAAAFLALCALSAISACHDDRPPDYVDFGCLAAGRCECRLNTDCQFGQACLEGRALLLWGQLDVLFFTGFVVAQVVAQGVVIGHPECRARRSLAGRLAHGFRYDCGGLATTLFWSIDNFGGDNRFNGFCFTWHEGS